MKNKIIERKELNLNKEREEFINYLDVSDKTLKLYGEGVKTFIAYLNANDIKNPTRNDFRAFKDTLKSKASVNTTNTYLSSVRRFFGYLEDNKIYEDITKDVKNVKTSFIPKRETLTIDECKKIYSSLTDEKEKAMFGLALTTGLRANEIATAKIENIKEYNGEIVLFHNCKKREDVSEYVKLSSQVQKDINNYIGQRTSGNIFISNSNHNYGKGVGYATIRRTIEGIFARYGYDSKNLTPHSLRRTCATLMYEAGQDIESIKQVLHHRSIATTTRYIQQCTRDKNEGEQLVSDLVLS